MTVEQESGVRQLLARSSDCVWRKDVEGYGAAWSEQGEWRILGQVATGREQVTALWRGFMDAFDRVWQVQHTIVLEAAGEDVLGRVYLEETLLLPDRSVQLTRGIYHDVYGVENGRWVFRRRHFDMTYFGPPDMAGKFFATAAYGPAPIDSDPTRPATPSMSDVYGAP